MNYKTLLVAVGVVVIGLYAIYTVVAPQARTALEGPANQPDTLSILENSEDMDVATPATTTGEVVASSNTVTDAPAATVSAPAPATKPPVSTTPVDTTPTPAGYTMADVAQHATASSCWSAINGQVYDLTNFIKKHPGGAKNILTICGKDGSRAFNGQHGGENKPENTLAGFEIGPLTQ